MGGIVEYFTQANSLVEVVTVCYTVGSLTVAGVRYAKKYLRSRFLKQMLGAKDIVIHIPSRVGEKEINESRIKPVVAMEDYNTAEKLRDVFVSNGFSVKLKYIPPDGNIEFERSRDNVKVANVVVCGPKNSRVIQDTFAAFAQLDFCKDGQDWYFYNKAKGTKYCSPIDKNQEQYGFLGRVDIRGNNALLICGIHAIGSDGVAFLLNDTAELDRLLKVVGNRNFCCLVCSEYSESSKEIYSARLADFLITLD